MRALAPYLVVLSLVVACGDDDDGDLAADSGSLVADSSTPVADSGTPADSGAPVPDSGDPDSAVYDGCVAKAVVSLVFYENVCVSAWIACDGAEQPPMPGDFGADFCDLENITCDAPDRDEHAQRSYVPKHRACEFCTKADGDKRCTRLPAGCGTFQIEHVGSGSAETGPKPWGSEACDDAGAADHDGGTP